MMQSEQERLDIRSLMHSIIVGEEGDVLSITTDDGRPATLVVIDPTTGEVIESGPDLVEEVWDVAVEAYRRFLAGKKALRVMSGPWAFMRIKKRTSSY